MKTHREIVIEAQRLDESARRLADEHRRAAAGRDTLQEVYWVLFGFPESRFTSQNYAADNDGDIAHTLSRRRRIEAAMVGDSLEYRLVQDEVETNATGAVVREVRSVLVTESESAEDVLEEGYDLAEQERLSDALVPYLERVQAGESLAGMEPQIVEEIEALVGAADLLPASRIQAKADVVRLVHGQIEPDDFITAAISRHRHCETTCECLAEHPRERQLIGHP